MKRVEFTIKNDAGEVLVEPGFVENCSELPLAVMQAMEDFLEVHQGQLHLPITIRIHPSSDSPTC